MKISCRFLTLAIFCLLGLSSAHSVSAKPLWGSVVEVIDGNTISVSVDKRLVRVTLCTVTPPALHDPLAEIARQHLAAFIKGKMVAIEYRSMSDDGSIAGIVLLADADIGIQMVRDGAGAYNRGYANLLTAQSRTLYEESEKAARAEARGIWQPKAPSVANVVKVANGPEATDLAELAKREARRLSDEAHALIGQRNNLAALPRAREAVRLDPTLAEAHKNLALALCDLGRYLEALPEVREAIRLKPSLDKSHNVLGKILLGLLDYEGSLGPFREAIRLNPKYAKAYYNLGVSLTRLGRLKEALAVYREADIHAPNDPLVHFNTAWVLYDLGRRAEAREHWSKVMTMGDPVLALEAEGNLNLLYPR